MPDMREHDATILVADDDAATRLVIVSTLEQEGFMGVEAADGIETIEKFQQGAPDMVLLDVEMPRMDGHEACAGIRRLPNGGDVPIVMVTGHNDAESINRAYELGATDFISKPIHWPLLGRRLRYILRGARNFQALGVSESKNRALLAAIPDHIYVVDESGAILTKLIGGESGEDVVAGSIRDVLPPALSDEAIRKIREVNATRLPASIEYPEVGSADEARWFEARFIHHADTGVLIIVRDVSERKQAEKRIHHLAYFDTLTGLPNRTFFKERCEKMLRDAASSENELAIFNIDLNRFKRINDTLGPSTGDAVLVEIAKRVADFATTVTGDEPQDRYPLTCCVARCGGNEFGLAISGIDQPVDTIPLAEQLRERLAAPILLNGHEFVVTPSIGVACYPDHGKAVDELFKNAESARGEAKRVGGKASRLYGHWMNSDVSECLDLENELRRALEQDELSLVYQPKFDTETLEINGAEALLRWLHPDRGHISPASFVPIAEDAGLIGDLGRWVADKVCAYIASWRRNGLVGVPIAINISGQDFALGDPVDVITDAVSRAGISASCLELEITETVLMSDIRSVMAALHSLRQSGFSIAVDDFGTGYSSLRYLQRFPVDVLKIDASFVRDVESNADSRAICTAIIALARSLGLKVVGEGVETDGQLEFLKSHRCDTLQGFLLGTPISGPEFTTLLVDSKAGERVSSSGHATRPPKSRRPRSADHQFRE